METNEYPTYYTTADEIQFINEIGKIPRKTPPIEMLRKYIIASQKREDWASIKKKEVIKAARQRMVDLKREEKMSIEDN